MEHFPDRKSENMRRLFDVEETIGGDNLHSVYDASLVFERKHNFPGYKKEKTIDQFVSENGETFFKITGKREIQFLTSQILGGAVNVSPIYIDEKGEYFSKKVAYPENMLDAAVGLFILNVLADDWDHEIPYNEKATPRNYENGSFFDFSHSEIAVENVQKNQNDQTIIRKTRHWLEETERILGEFLKSRDISDVTKEDLNNEVRKILTEKLNLLREFISSEEVLKKIYEKIGYYAEYQHGILDPQELREILLQKISIILEQLVVGSDH
ncbi:MAG: hypothetical protein HYT94_03615 [Parcubacteria group bacterium]|nr:hypothetical protein [Parcubacteria group bacterium]